MVKGKLNNYLIKNHENPLVNTFTLHLCLNMGNRSNEEKIKLMFKLKSKDSIHFQILFTLSHKIITANKIFLCFDKWFFYH